MPDTKDIWIYVGIFAALVAAGLGAPIPEEIPVVTAGAMSGHASSDPHSQHPLWFILLPICILGVVISDGLLYGMGRWFGPKLLEHRWMKRILPDEKRARIEDNFRHYGIWVLLFARVMPTIRSPIFITAGVMRLSFAKFLLADGIYAIPGVSLLFFLAYWFGDTFTELVERAEERVERIRFLIILALIAAAAGFMLYHFLRRPVSTGDPDELPIIGPEVASKIEHLSHPVEPDGQPTARGTIIRGKAETKILSADGRSPPDEPAET
ncbi:MAG: DedA family protein [Gemmataceae bacterium]